MKRRELVRHLEEDNCQHFREGARHTIYLNRRHERRTAAIACLRKEPRGQQPPFLLNLMQVPRPRPMLQISQTR
jgi:hypothetical protein